MEECEDFGGLLPAFGVFLMRMVLTGVDGGDYGGIYPIDQQLENVTTQGKFEV